MRRSWSEWMWVAVQLALLASAEIVEAFEPRPTAPRWQHSWHRTALRATIRQRVA